MKTDILEYTVSNRRGALILVFTILAVFVLFWHRPFATAVLLEGRAVWGPLVPFFYVMGVLFAALIFVNPPGVEIWLHSRGISRQTLFLKRVVSGLLLIVGATCWVGILMATGLRQIVQQNLQSPFFPMIRWYELRILPDLFLCAAMAYSLTLAFMMAWRNRLTNQGIGLMGVPIPAAAVVGVPVMVSAVFSPLAVVLAVVVIPALSWLIAWQLADQNELAG